MCQGRLKPWGPLQTPGPWETGPGFLLGTSSQNLNAHWFIKTVNDLLQVRKSFPYLTTAHFPHNWAIADMVKGYLAGTRWEHHRQSREGSSEDVKPSDHDDCHAQKKRNPAFNPKHKKPSRESSVNHDPCDDDSHPRHKQPIATNSTPKTTTSKQPRLAHLPTLPLTLLLHSEMWNIFL